MKQNKKGKIIHITQEMKKKVNRVKYKKKEKETKTKNLQKKKKKEIKTQIKKHSWTQMHPRHDGRRVCTLLFQQQLSQVQQQP